MLLDATPMSEMFKETVINTRPPIFFSFSLIAYAVIAVLIICTLVTVNILMITHIKKMRKSMKEK